MLFPFSSFSSNFSSTEISQKQAFSKVFLAISCFSSVFRFLFQVETLSIHFFSNQIFWCLSVHPEISQGYPGPPTGRRAPSVPKTFFGFFFLFFFFCEKAFSFLELEVLIFSFFFFFFEAKAFSFLDI